MKVLPVGQYVKHYRYGFGLVLQSDDQETAIEFQQHGSKRFITGLLDVELSDFTPPPDFREKWVKTPALPRRPRVDSGALRLKAQEKLRVDK